MFFLILEVLISNSAAEKMDCIVSVNLNTRTIHDSWQDVAALLPKKLTQRFEGVNVIDKSKTKETGIHVPLLFQVYEERFCQHLSRKLEFLIHSILLPCLYKNSFD